MVARNSDLIQAQEKYRKQGLKMLIELQVYDDKAKGWVETIYDGNGTEISSSFQPDKFRNYEVRKQVKKSTDLWLLKALQ